MRQLIIDNEFRDLIPELRPEEYAGLEQSILEDGCRDPLVVWLEENILVDGHNREAICSNHNLPYSIVYKSFNSRWAVKIWIRANQILYRRNLTDTERNLLLAEQYEEEKQPPGNKDGRNQYAKELDHSGQVPQSTRKTFAERYGCGEGTVQRAVNTARALEALTTGDDPIIPPELAKDIKKENTPITQKALRQFGGVAKNEPKIAKAAIDEMAAGNAKTAKQALTYARREERQLEAQQLPDTIFNVIYADPPWQYSNTGLEGSAASHYPTMATENICTLLEDQSVLLTKNAVLFLWVTSPLLEDGFKVLNSWGFNYKAAMIWGKPYKNQGKSGWYLQTHHEHLLIATRGKCTPHYQPQSVQLFAKNEHSAKPHEFRDIIERMYPDYNYLELFARNQPPRDGWVFWGNEV